MGLQTDELVMVAIDSRRDAPPVASQPPLRDGIHHSGDETVLLGIPWVVYHR